jgi:hypothetical protein
MAQRFVNEKNQLTAQAFWFWWLRTHGHIRVRSSPPPIFKFALNVVDD